MVRSGPLARGGGSARPRRRFRNRIYHALREFLALPLLVAGASVLLAMATIALDRAATAPWSQPIRSHVAKVVPPGATSLVLSTIAPGLLTVVSIIFFVLLMGVQHQSATYSPVVLDQFLRRRTNQLFFGLFVGLAVYCLLPLAFLPQGQAIVSGTLAVVLTAVTFFSLLVFVYSTVDQMRPSATVWMLQNLALQARLHQQSFISRCRAAPEYADTPSTDVTSGNLGFVVGLDGDLLANALHPVQDRVEIELRTDIGDHVVPGQRLARIRGGDRAERDRLAEAILDAIALSRMRDIDQDPVHAVDQLANIAWSATATSGDPEGARIAVETLHGLLVRFQEQDEHYTADAFGGPLPVVHYDRLTDRILDGLTSVIAASAHSGQHQTYSAVLLVLARCLPRLQPENQRTAVDRIRRVLHTSRNHVFTSQLEHAFTAIDHAMRDVGLQEGARHVNDLATGLSNDQHSPVPGHTPP